MTEREKIEELRGVVRTLRGEYVAAFENAKEIYDHSLACSEPLLSKVENVLARTSV